MRLHHEILTIRTGGEPEEFADVTAAVRAAVARSGVRAGLVVVQASDGTLALFVNEFQRALLRDLRRLLHRLVPRQGGYGHGDAHAHLRSMLLGRSVALAVADGQPVLGRFESVIAADLVGPSERTLTVEVIGQ